MNKGPLVSVIIPCYNSSATLPRALNSVLAQSYSNMEIIVVDDCSRDNPELIVKKFEKVIFHRLDKNGGASAARNIGIKKSQGEFIAFLDADDEWLTNKISVQIKIMLESELNPGLVTCNSAWIGKGEEGKDSNYYLSHPPVRGNEVWKELLKRNFIPTPTVLIRKSVFNSIQIFDESLKVAEDLDFWIRISQKYNVDYSTEVLVNFHLTKGSLMERNSDKVLNTTLQVIKKYLQEYSKCLQNGEGNKILGYRYLNNAYESLVNRKLIKAINFSIQALFLGYKPIKSFGYILASILMFIPLIFSGKSQTQKAL